MPVGLRWVVINLAHRGIGTSRAAREARPSPRGCADPCRDGTFPPLRARHPREDRPLTALRLALLILLVALVLLPWRGGPGSARAVEDAHAGSAAPAPAAWVRRSADPPTAAELDRLSALAGRAPLLAAGPAAGPRLEVFPPERPTAGRNAAVDWRLRGGRPGDEVFFTLSDAGGPLDSARVRLDTAGTAAGAFRVRPTEAGWHDWRVSAGRLEASAGAWVRSGRPVRVLVATEPGSLEAREVARALERAGADVTVATDLGRGLSLGDAPAGLPDRIASLRAVDVVVVLSGSPLPATAAAVLQAFVRDGGGALIAGPAAATVPGIVAAPARSVEAGDWTWSAPAAIEPLPPPAGRSPLVPLVTQEPAWTAARLGDAPAIALVAEGRGRWAALGLIETWPWALEAGRTDELAAFWISLVHWLADGATDPVVVTVDPATAAPGLPIDVRLAVLDSAADRPDRLLLVRAPGTTDSLRIAWRGDRGHARFIATARGILEVRLGADSPAVAAHRADPAAPPGPGAWSDLARVAAASGGRLVPADSLAAVAPAGRGAALRLLLVTAVALLAIADWAARRVRGRA